ncbi:hypothetical protein CTAYLR_007708 [Chrysophaeum taylorii]|uniref:Protein kinase domain-containing protein n=1 Tax=Chrysophaeum taylorii TaxID=2483200 RepID=A0AAD7UCD9_9STRA|nr:hypothetical protein CTAYLR_007708 [Chrysophaeum taylorii]
MGPCLSLVCRTRDLYKGVPNVWFEEKDIWKEYEFGEALGEGVYATVLKVKNLKTEKISAAKHFSKRTVITNSNQIHFAPDAEGLMEEVAILKLLKGESYCLRLDGIIETKSELYILTQICDSDLMNFVVERDVTTESDAAEWSRQLLTAVAHCHSHFVMHRDVKPENVLMSDGRVVLADFGSAVRFKPGQRFFQERGSSFWSSPETWANDYDFTADLWSCGLVILTLVDGMPSSGQIRELHAMGLGAFFEHGAKFENKHHDLSEELLNVLRSLLRKKNRISASEALDMDWFSSKFSSDKTLGSAASRYGKLSRTVHAAIFGILDNLQRVALAHKFDHQNGSILVSSADLKAALIEFDYPQVCAKIPDNQIFHLDDLLLPADRPKKTRGLRRSVSSKVPSLDFTWPRRAASDEAAAAAPVPREAAF